MASISQTWEVDIEEFNNRVRKMRTHIKLGDRAPIDDWRLAAVLTPYQEVVYILRTALGAMDDKAMTEFLDRLTSTTP